MTTCDQCGTRVLFGGVERAGLRFCGARCADRSVLLQAAAALGEAEVARQAEQTHRGLCPRCSGPGPVDVYVAHTVWSALILTSWRSQPQLSCQSCGRWAQLQALFLSGVAGWWGVPWGLLITPIQIVRNLSALLSPPRPDQPSPALLGSTRRLLATQLLADPGAARSSTTPQLRALPDTPAAPDAGQDSVSWVFKLAAVLSLVFFCLPFIPLILGLVATAGTWRTRSAWRIVAWIGTGLAAIATLFTLLAMLVGEL